MSVHTQIGVLSSLADKVLGCTHTHEEVLGVHTHVRVFVRRVVLASKCVCVCVCVCVYTGWLHSFECVDMTCFPLRVSCNCVIFIRVMGKGPQPQCHH